MMYTERQAQMNKQSLIDRSISYSEQQHFLFITLAHNRVHVLCEQEVNVSARQAMNE
jgi:hypothetical protein